MIEKLKEPIINLIKTGDLLAKDIYFLKFSCKTSKNEFVICCRGLNMILINANHKKAAELKEITRKLMKYEKVTQDTSEKIIGLIDDFREIAGEYPSRILYNIWDRRYRANQKEYTVKQLSLFLKTKQEVFLNEAAYAMCIDWTKSHNYNTQSILKNGYFDRQKDNITKLLGSQKYSPISNFILNIAYGAECCGFEAGFQYGIKLM